MNAAKNMIEGLGKQEIISKLEEQFNILSKRRIKKEKPLITRQVRDLGSLGEL